MNHFIGVVHKELKQTIQRKIYRTLIFLKYKNRYTNIKPPLNFICSFYVNSFGRIHLMTFQRENIRPRKNKIVIECCTDNACLLVRRIFLKNTKAQIFGTYVIVPLTIENYWDITGTSSVVNTVNIRLFNIRLVDGPLSQHSVSRRSA